MFQGSFCRMGVLVLSGILGGLSGCSRSQAAEEDSTPGAAPAAVASATPAACVFPEDYPVRLVSVEVDPVYDAMLEPRPEGWLGSDVAESIPLSPEKTLWLFGDTLIGKIADGKRDKAYEFINSTIGIQDRTQPPPGNIEFHWGREGGLSRSFFPHQPGTAGQFYWVCTGALLRGELFLLAYPIKYSTEGWIDDTVMIRVPNPQDPPEQWIQKAYVLGLGDDRQGFLSGLFVEEPYLYCLGRDQGSMVLARVLIDDLVAGKLGEAFEFWVEGDAGAEWGAKPESLVPLFRPGVTETALQFEPDWGLYICTTYFPSRPGIYITVAPALTGPWSEPTCVYQVPEHGVSFPIISYAVRPHPELSRKAGELILSYATNAFKAMEPLFTEEGLRIYYPRFLRVQLEPAESGEE